MSNEKFVKVRDEHGLINLMGGRAKYSEEDLQKQIEGRMMMDNSILVPEDLIIRSLPVNVELLELIREKESRESQSIIQNIGKFIHLDRLDENEAKFYR